MRVFKAIKNLQFWDILLVIVLLFVLWIRVNNFEYPLSNNETSRDYLVASHIANYGEIPILGPHNGGLDLPINSPVYYYFLSVFLFIWDELLFLEAVNIALQMVVIAAVYFLGKVLFGAKAGLVGAILLASSYMVLAESYSLWQPYVMLPFINIAILLLAIAYSRRSYLPALAGGLVMSFAGALHISALGLIPVYWIFEYLTFRKLRKDPLAIANAMLAQIILLVLFYAPVIYYHLTNPLVGSPLFSRFESNPLTVAINFFENSITFIKFFLITWNLWPYVLPAAAAIAFYFLVKEGDESRRLHFAVCLLTIVWLLALSAFLNVPIRGYYFIPVFGFFVLVVAELICKFSEKNLATLVLSVVLVVLLAKAFSWNFAFDRHKITTHAQEQMDAMTAAVAGKVEEIKNSEGMTDFLFFRIFVLERNDLNPSDAPFWVTLEKSFGVKLATVTNGGNTFTVFSRDDYIFLVCKLFLEGEQQDCLNLYGQRTAGGYNLVEGIYNHYPFAIHLLKKI